MKSNVKKIAVPVLVGMAMLTSLGTGIFPDSSLLLNTNASGHDYNGLIDCSLYFYDCNRCGSNANNGKIDWRGACHTSDEIQGGYHDAGDHVKFGLPAGYSASTLGWGYYEFGTAYDSNATAHLKEVTDYFCQYFKNCTKMNGGNVEGLCYQIGDGDEDHSYWGPPEAQSGARKAYWTWDGGSDIAAEYAAALALNYINFGNTDDLTYAKALYDFSVKNNKITSEGTTPFYASDGYEDDQAWAAGWLYIATGDSRYKNDCASKQQFIGWGHCWNNVSLGAACINAEITGDWSSVNNYLSEQCTDPYTYFCLNEWGSARYNTAIQLAAYTETIHGGGKDYSEWCKGQMNMILGDNNKNACLVVGFQNNSVKYPHHRGASGYTSYDDLNNSSDPSKYKNGGHELTGALVGGPKDSNFTYQDTMSDYQCNEVAIDYNAALPGAAAAIAGGKHRDSTNVPDDKPNNDNNGNNVSFKTGTETGSEGNTFQYCTFEANGASSCTVTYKVNTDDGVSTGAFGTSVNGNWTQQQTIRMNIYPY